MIKKYFGDKLRKAKSSERAEAMPAAIITAIVSSLLLLGIATTVSLVVQNKADSEGNVGLTTVASNIDVSLRSDVTNATYISASAKLKQPTTRLLAPTDLTVSGANLHIPSQNGECKVVRWTITGTTVTRDLTVYPTTKQTDAVVKCDETTTPIAKRTKVFADDINIKNPLKFYNQVGRELAFTISDSSLTTLNTNLDTLLKQKNVTRLSDADFTEFSKQLTADGITTGFIDPAACVMNAPAVNGVCPAPESDSVAAAWNSLKIAKVSVQFEMTGSTNGVVMRDIEQNSTVPLYSSAAEAEAAVAGSITENKPAPPVTSISATRVTLGTNYTISWTASDNCPTDMVKTYELYENNALIKSTTSLSFVKAHTNSADEYVSYVVQIKCVRGALVVTSDMSNVVKAKVIPAVPTMVINQQPTTTNAALNSNLQSTATCLYGTTPRYNVTQTTATYGTVGTAVSNLTSVSRPINSGFQVVEGARYQYRIDAWCASAFDVSPQNNLSTNTFTTVINTPSVAATFSTPVNGSTNISPTVNVWWNAATCAVGTTAKYYSVKNTDAGAALATPTVIDNWTTNRYIASNNTQGNTVGYGITSRCDGTAGVVSGSSVTNTVSYTTLINTPSAVTFVSPAKGATGVSTGIAVQWSTVTCAPSTTAKYYVTKNLDSGSSITPVVVGNWMPPTSIPTNNTQGNTVGYTVAARCDGPNAVSSSTATDSLTYTTGINAPAAPAFTSPSNNATGAATALTVTWNSVVCATGTTTKYYSTKNIDAGNTITPVIIDNWNTDLSLASSTTEGRTVGYTVAARCEGPNAVSSSSSTSQVQYTTLINAPTIPYITGPANGSTKVPVGSTLAWSAVTCATGTTAKYYTTKDVDAGAAITPIVIDNWTTDLSYVLQPKQGYIVRYTAEARCEGPNANSVSSGQDRSQFTTRVEAPAAVTAWNDGWGGVANSASSCAPEATLYYRVKQNLADNSWTTFWGGWTTDSGWKGLPGWQTGGYPQWAEVETFCKGLQDDSTITPGANNTKWVKNFYPSFSAGMQWRRMNVWASCPWGTYLSNFYLYVNGDGWNGARTSDFSIQTDEGYWIAGAYAGGGGNSGWVQMNINQNWGWIGTTANWGYWGNYGWGSKVTQNSRGDWSDMTGTYWNASGWGSYAYWWYGECYTDFMVGGGKGSYWSGGNWPRNTGDPGTRYNAARDGTSYTQAGIDATR